MATLQNIRSKGPLLVIVIGLALFAFIAGDAWKVMQPHQSQDIGEVNGDALSAQDYQAMVEEFTEFNKFIYRTNSFTEEQNDIIKDQVWDMYVSNQIVKAEAEKIGLTVSDEELQAIIDAGAHPMLQQLPFRNPQTGAFDSDQLKQFLAEYGKMDMTQMPAQYVESYRTIYKVWHFIEKMIVQQRLQEKYNALIAQCLLSNPVEAQTKFDARNAQVDLLLAAVPFSSVADSAVNVTDSELKSLYDKKKEQFKQAQEVRNVKYIDVQVVASAEDKAELQKEMQEYTDQLAQSPADYTTYVRSTASVVPYIDIFRTTRSLPADVTARLDSVAVGGVFGPYYNVADNTLNSFKKLAVAQMADSIQSRQIQVVAETPEKTKTLADSIYNAIKGGADFAEIAKKYGQTGEASWLATSNFEGQELDAETVKYFNAMVDAQPNQLQNIALGQGNIILQVMAKKAATTKYKVAVVKRPVEFSKETYSKAYNDFSAFIAANNTLEKMAANAEDAGYRLLDKYELRSNEHNIGGIRSSKQAVKWAFESKPGEVSGLYECGESDRLLVVAVSNVVREGYRPFGLVKEQLRYELLRDKKADKILADMKAAGATTFDQYKAMDNAVTDSVKLVTFAANAHVPALRASEPLVSAYAAVGELNQLSAPIKGRSSVFVLQPYAKENQSETFDAAKEQAQQASMHVRMAQQAIRSDLYEKAEVKDTRYLYF